jgi:hypothetical protein
LPGKVDDGSDLVVYVETIKADVKKRLPFMLRDGKTPCRRIFEPQLEKSWLKSRFIYI